MKQYIPLILGLFLSACTVTRPISSEGWQEKIVETERLSFAVWEKDIIAEKPLRIYIEGDGFPNPKKPIAFKLAQKDPMQNVIYVTRPCQYVKNKVCSNPLIWGEERFHQEILTEMKELIVYLSIKYKTPVLELVGYDGGGTMALLLASQIPVARVITIAGILDTKAYVLENDLPEINGLNPADFKETLAKIPQVHYVGSDDTLTTRRMAERFVARIKNPVSAVVKVVPNTNHTDWETVKFDYYNSSN